MLAETMLHDSYANLLTPLVGMRLQSRRVAVFGLAAVAGAAERLADCRVLHWQIGDTGPLHSGHPLVRLGGRTVAGLGADVAFAEVVQSRAPHDDRWTCAAVPPLTVAGYTALRDALAANPPDLLLGGGDESALTLLYRLARDLNIAAVGVALLAGVAPRAAVLVALPGDGEQGRDWADLLRVLGNPTILDPLRATATPDRWLDWQDANGHAAALARMLLLQGSRFAPADLTRLIVAERRTALLLGAPDWPWHLTYRNLAELQSVAVAACPASDTPIPGPPAHSVAGPVLVVGCGSLGSQVARTLVAAGIARDLILVDPARVTPNDLVAEFYTAAQVGQNKADALAQSLLRLVPAGQNHGWMVSVFADGWNGTVTSNATWSVTRVAHRAGRNAHFAALLTSLRPALAIISVGSTADAELAAVLRERGIPHIVGRCDTDGTHYEAVLVDGKQGPCFRCLGGDQFPLALAGTPGTMVETGRAADLLARLVWHLSQTAATRPAWFTQLLLAGQGALVGGNGVEQVRLWPPMPDTEPPTTYGITVPGQVVAQRPHSLCLDCLYS